ncbi:MAG TPA: hypothetical protein VI958_00460, partial [Acidobacteriota bacterium]
ETNWGSIFVAKFYNKLELLRPFIDNLYPELAAMTWAMQNEPLRNFTLPQAGRFFVMLSQDQKALDNLGFIVCERSSETV